MFSDPLFWVAGVSAVLLTGLSKGGVGAGFALLSVPLLSLVMPPLQAAAIMLPILIVMDAVAVLTYRGKWNLGHLKVLLPGAVAGIAIAGLMAGAINDNHVRLVVGFIAIAFAAKYWLGRGRKAPPSAPRSPAKAQGTAWGAVAGFTSFIAHAGGPPAHMYLLPQRMEKTMFVATNAAFFACVNLIKTAPYAALGQFSSANLLASAVLAPIAPIGVLVGARIVKIMPEKFFYQFAYAMVVIVGAKLLWDGVMGA